MINGPSDKMREGRRLSKAGKGLGGRSNGGNEDKVSERCFADHQVLRRGPGIG